MLKLSIDIKQLTEVFVLFGLKISTLVDKFLHLLVILISLLCEPASFMVFTESLILLSPGSLLFLEAMLLTRRQLRPAVFPGSLVGAESGIC